MVILEDLNLVKVDIGDAEVLQSVDADDILHQTEERETDKGPTQVLEVVHHQSEFEVDGEHGKLDDDRLLVHSHEYLREGQQGNEHGEEGVEALANRDKTEEDVQFVICTQQ